MRDPLEFVQFFKQRVFFEMEESYEDFLEQVRSLKENHILMKGHERAHSKTIKKIAEDMRKNLLQTESVQSEFGKYPESIRNDTVDNLVETVIYERIGTYLRKSLIALYTDEETRFNDKLRQLQRLYKTNVRKFNEVFGSAFKSEVVPTKSLKIFKVFFRCQIPYEMFFALHETLQMATEELSKHLNKPKSAIDAQTLTTYIIVILINAREQLEKEEVAFNYKVRLLMMEHFTVHTLGMSEQTYSYVTFKEAENCVDTVDLA